MATLKWNPPSPPQTIALFRNTDNKALDVHYGGSVYRADGSSYPDRPWMTTAVDEMDIETEFILNFRRFSQGKTGYITFVLIQAFRATADQLHQAMLNNLTDERWEWDRETVRSDGAIVSSPRNIRDTDQLYDSQTLEYTDSAEDGQTEQVDFE